MSACAEMMQLEAVAMGEAPPALAAQLRAHSRACARCRHELQWLESELTLFRQRQGRDEVAQLWEGFEQRQAAQRPRRWPAMTAFLAVAAALVLWVGRAPSPVATPVGVVDERAEQAFESSPLMSPVLFLEGEVPCSKLPSGVGFQCSPAVPASFIASR